MTDDPFVRHRHLLFTVAYAMLGSAADAEDVELAESVSMAMLTVLETLAPAERAVFVLREVFETPYDEIAEAVGKTPAAVRQIAHRAREHVTARRRVGRAEHRAVVDRFVTAINTGEMQELMELLAPDVVMINDGGGVVQAARKPIVGAEKLIALLAIGLRRAPAPLVCVPVWINGEPGLRMELAGEVVAAISLTVEADRITRIYSVWNPHKLSRLDEGASLSRA